MTTIVWFRRDLRLADHSPLRMACERGGPVLPLFIWDPTRTPWATGAASRVWLHHSLHALAQSLEALGSRLLLRIGPPEAVLAALAEETRATALVFNRRLEPAERELEARIARRLGSRLDIETGGDAVLIDPAALHTAERQPYRVFTPFWRRLREVCRPPSPASPPRRLVAPATWPAGATLADLGLLPRLGWDRGITDSWQIGELAAAQRLDAFVADGAADYAVQRDFPGVDGVSRLSPHLHFGEVSPRQVWHAVAAHAAAQGQMTVPETHVAWLRQLVWREFAQHLLAHFPATTDAPLREDFAHFPWVEDPDGLARWQRGETGFPIVDAGMRELWHTGWMHNRVRMIVASFLTKDLGVHWLAGRAGSGTRWSTRISRTTPSAGSGRPAVARMPRRISACSIRSCKARASTPRAATCGAGCRRSRGCRRRTFTPRGRRRR
jgi:deoxyribodipyrimidine photo-lyase